MAECAECGDNKKLEYEDIRSPPMDEGICLCKDCYITAILECIDESMASVEDLFHLSKGIVPEPIRALEIQRLIAIAENID